MLLMMAAMDNICHLQEAMAEMALTGGDFTSCEMYPGLTRCS